MCQTTILYLRRCLTKLYNNITYLRISKTGRYYRPAMAVNFWPDSVHQFYPQARSKILGMSYFPVDIVGCYTNIEYYKISKLINAGQKSVVKNQQI